MLLSWRGSALLAVLFPNVRCYLFLVLALRYAGPSQLSARARAIAKMSHLRLVAHDWINSSALGFFLRLVEEQTDAIELQ